MSHPLTGMDPEVVEKELQKDQYLMGIEVPSKMSLLPLPTSSAGFTLTLISQEWQVLKGWNWPFACVAADTWEEEEMQAPAFLEGEARNQRV